VDSQIPQYIDRRPRARIPTVAQPHAELGNCYPLLVNINSKESQIVAANDTQMQDALELVRSM
jgi:hypothetical protein